MPDLLELPRLEIDATVDDPLLVLEVSRRDSPKGAFTASKPA